MQNSVPLRLERWSEGLPGRLGGMIPGIQGNRWSKGQRAGGVLLLGGDCSALGVGRVLQRSGIEMRFLPGPNRLATLSRFLQPVPGWPGAEAPGALDWLEGFAMTGGTAGWVLIAAGDSEVRLVTGNHERLSRSFRLTTPPWDVTRFAADKQLTYARAAELGVGHPRTYRIADAEAAAAVALDYPVVLKPAMKEGVNALTIDKAWRADDREQFLKLFAEGARLAGAGGLVVQELIPDDGKNQFSYCAFCEEGEPKIVMAARRVRQRPRKAGTGTYVETLDPQPFERDAEIFLRSLSYSGLVEIEFMRDPRDGRFKLIDVNPRIWTWHALGLAAGVNFPLAVWQSANGLPVATGRAAAGHSWLYALRDLPVALSEILDGTITPAAYLRQLSRVSALATFAWSDPLPALADVPISLWRRLSR